MRAWRSGENLVTAELEEGDTLGHVEGPATLEIVPRDGLLLWDALRESGIAIEPAPVLAPDNPTLRDWRVGLLRWGRLEEVSGKVKALIDEGNPMGAVALESLEYANNVLRSQLLQLREVFGFTEAEVEESLWRAERVRMGDLSGEWPLLAATKTA